MSESAPQTSEKPQQSRAPLKAEDLKAPRLYVGNMAFAVTKEDLEAELKNNNLTASTITVMAYPSGKSKGCAIIEFSSTEDAAAAANCLTNKELKGRNIYAREDREEAGFATTKKPAGERRSNDTRPGTESRGRGRGRGGARGGRGGVRRGAMSIFSSRGGKQRGSSNTNERTEKPERKENTDGSRLFVGNLKWEYTGEQLKDLFSAHGSVVSADIAQDKYNKRSKGFGTVKMSSEAEATAAIQALNEKEIEGRKLQVRKDNYA